MQKGKYEIIIRFGKVLWDMLLTGFKPGGALLNLAILLKKHGINPILISKTGNNLYDDKYSNLHYKSCVSTKFIQKEDKLACSQILAHLDKNKNESYDYKNRLFLTIFIYSKF